MDLCVCPCICVCVCVCVCNPPCLCEGGVWICAACPSLAYRIYSIDRQSADWSLLSPLCWDEVEELRKMGGTRGDLPSRAQYRPLEELLVSVGMMEGVVADDGTQGGSSTVASTSASTSSTGTPRLVVPKAVKGSNPTVKKSSLLLQPGQLEAMLMLQPLAPGLRKNIGPPPMEEGVERDSDGDGETPTTSPQEIRMQALRAGRERLGLAKLVVKLCNVWMNVADPDDELLISEASLVSSTSRWYCLASDFGFRSHLQSSATGSHGSVAGAGGSQAAPQRFSRRAGALGRGGVAIGRGTGKPTDSASGPPPELGPPTRQLPSLADLARKPPADTGPPEGVGGAGSSAGTGTGPGAPAPTSKEGAAAGGAGRGGVGRGRGGKRGAGDASQPGARKPLPVNPGAGGRGRAVRGGATTQGRGAGASTGSVSPPPGPAPLQRQPSISGGVSPPIFASCILLSSSQLLAAAPTPLGMLVAGVSPLVALVQHGKAWNH